jgi:hypothetical protein
MKKTLFILLMLGFVYTNGYSQKDKEKIKCKYSIDKKDEFTGESVKAISFLLFFGNMEFGFRRTADKYVIDYTVKFTGKRNQMLNKGDELQIKLASDEILTFKSDKDVPPVDKVVATSSSATVYSTYKTEYTITPDELNKIANSAPTIMKLTVGTETNPFNIGKGEGTKIQNAAYCITQ